VSRPLSKLNNKGFFSVIAAITTKDPQVTFGRDKIELRPGQEVKTTMTVTAVSPGKYESTIHIGMFLPLLPPGAIYKLVEINYWMALVTISLIPGLPIMLYPLIEGGLRRSVVREIRRRVRRIKQGLSFS
jgi:signal peptidase